LSSKDEHITLFLASQARAAKQGYILNGESASTHSALEPAFLNTSLCSDPDRRVPLLIRKKVYHESDHGLA
jgi:hypothetical protein